jgi:hypothetical protein
LKTNERKAKIYWKKKEYAKYEDDEDKDSIKILDNFRKECEAIFENNDHKVFYNIGTHLHYNKPLLKEDILPI